MSEPTNDFEMVQALASFTGVPRRQLERVIAARPLTAELVALRALAAAVAAYLNAAGNAGAGSLGGALVRAYNGYVQTTNDRSLTAQVAQLSNDEDQSKVAQLSTEDNQ